MCGRHQERPHEETGKSYLHAEAHAVAMAEAPVVEGPADQEERGGDADRSSVHKPAHPQKDERNGRDRHRMPRGDWREREPDDATTPAGEGRAPRRTTTADRVQPVKCAEAGNREP